MFLKHVFHAGAKVLCKLERETVSLSNLFDYILILFFFVMDRFYSSTTNFVIAAFFKDYNFNVFDNFSVFYIFLFDVRLHEDDLRRSKNVAVLLDCT